MMRNISDFVNVRWFVGEHFTEDTFSLLIMDKGIPFNDSSNFRLEIAQSAQEILGDYLMGVQAGRSE